jgi:hypothetical protein
MKTNIYLGNIVLQEKGEGDWRAFVHCQDEENHSWELRAYGKTPVEAVQNAYERFNSRYMWDVCGYKTN